MPDPLDNSAPFDDKQGTKRADEAAGPTGAGAEATEGTQGEPESSSHEHRSGYGGDGGKPKGEPDVPQSDR